MAAKRFEAKKREMGWVVVKRRNGALVDKVGVHMSRNEARKIAFLLNSGRMIIAKGA